MFKVLLWHQIAPKHHCPEMQTSEDWLKFINVWRRFTVLRANRQGSPLVLSLEDETLDAEQEIDDENIAKENRCGCYN